MPFQIFQPIFLIKQLFTAKVKSANINTGQKKYP